ncbi:MAG TPA: caspase family protein [Acidimicrobiales bacterium]|nr:caspase family protein [Acidimicrobiales bacterium]
MRRLLGFLGVVSLAFAGFGVHGPSAGAAPPYGVNKWALIIGIDTFTKGNPTKKNVGSRGDAEDLNALLRANGWPADHIRLLVDQAATQAAIRDGMKWLADNSNPSSFSVFHYSGHVNQITDKKDRDKDGEVQDEFLWPADATTKTKSGRTKYISDNELGANMRNLQGWAWVDISGCEGAGLNDGISSERHLFTASSQEPEKSYEDGKWKNSIFSGLMLDYGMLQKRADADGNGVVTLHEAFRFAAQYAPGMTANQGCNKKGQNCKPQHPYMAGGDGTEWLLDPPPPPPPPPPPKQKKKSCALNICI